MRAGNQGFDNFRSVQATVEHEMEAYDSLPKVIRDYFKYSIACFASGPVAEVFERYKYMDQSVKSSVEFKIAMSIQAVEKQMIEGDESSTWKLLGIEPIRGGGKTK